MRKIEMVDLKSQYDHMKEEIDRGMAETIESTAFINGQPVKDFANELAGYIGAKHAIPCGNGTDALQIALMALNIQEGDEVITSPFTFVATAEVIALLKLKPVFVDIQPDTFNIDPKKIEDAITERTKCIIPVHLFGQSVDMAPIMALAKKHHLSVVEDNAQSIGATYSFPSGEKVKTGAIGDIGTTSFYPTKNLGGYGDGGALSTNDSQLNDKIRKIANHGSDTKYYYDEIGVNSRLDTFQAVVLRAKLKRLDDYNNSRQQAADYYDTALREIDGITLPFRAPYSNHVFHQYTLQVHENRDMLKEHLNENGIPCMVYYPVPLHISKAYARYGYSEGDFAVAEEMSRKVISLPMHSELDDEQLKFITSTIKDFFKK